MQRAKNENIKVAAARPFSVGLPLYVLLKIIYAI